MPNKSIGKEIDGHVHDCRNGQEWEPGRRNKRPGKEHAEQMQGRRFKKHRRCFLCGKSGHVMANCRNKESHQNKDSDFTLGMADLQDEHGDIWILDSGSSRHPISNKNWLGDVKMLLERVCSRMETINYYQ